MSVRITIINDDYGQWTPSTSPPPSRIMKDCRWPDTPPPKKKQNKQNKTEFNRERHQILSDSSIFVQKLYLNGFPYLEVQLLEAGSRRASSGTRADESQVYAISKVVLPFKQMNHFWERAGGGNGRFRQTFQGLRVVFRRSSREETSPYPELRIQSEWDTDAVLSLYELS